MPLSFRNDVTARGERPFPTSQLEQAVTHRPCDYDVISSPGRRTWRSGQGEDQGRGEGQGRFASSAERSLKGAANPRPYFYDLDFRRPRVQTYSENSSISSDSGVSGRPRARQRAKCTCCPVQGHGVMPSMTYKHHHCPRHPHRTQLPVIPEQFAYPWTMQSYRPRHRLEYGYKRGQVLPPSAVTGPPFVQYTSKPRHRHRHHHPPPHTAPDRPPSSLLLTLPLSDRRLRRVDRRRGESGLPASFRLPEDDVAPWDSVSQVAPPVEVSPWDSVSQVAPPVEVSPWDSVIRVASPVEVSPWDSVSQVAPFRRPHLRPLPPPSRPLRLPAAPGSSQPGGLWRRRRRERESQWSGRAAADTPRPGRYVDPPPLPGPSTRLFKGDYNQPDDNDLVARAKRRQLRTV